jgi:hypothetical protein
VLNAHCTALQCLGTAGAQGKFVSSRTVPSATHHEEACAMVAGGAVGPTARSPIGRYANVFRVGFNAFEVVIEFGEQFSDSEEARVHTRIVTNPMFARGLIDSLNDALARYADTYSSNTQR